MNLERNQLEKGDKVGLLKILKAVTTDEKEIDKYDLSKEEKEEVKKGNYQADEFDRDDDEDSDED